MPKHYSLKLGMHDTCIIGCCAPRRPPVPTFSSRLATTTFGMLVSGDQRRRKGRAEGASAQGPAILGPRALYGI